MAEYKIAVIRGDGIGVEVMEEGLKVLNAIADRYDIKWDFVSFLGAQTTISSTDT